jgi:serine/threonine protein kinase
MTDAQQIHNDLAAMVGSVLAGTYRLDALIGEGGMGAVFRGRHVLLRRDVAIKVLHPDFGRDPELVKRFDREAQSAARLNHPNCIQVTEFGSAEGGMKYLVMQLLEGTELQNVVDGPVEPLRAVDLILQVLRGLEHAHGQGVVHRDLKPQNIFVTRDHEGREVLKLVDFGIAKIIGGDGAHDQMTRAGMVFGTPQYMSPEQALGLEIDARADLYAAGILLYQFVTGKLPFNSDDPVALIRMQVSTEPPPLPPTVPAELAAIVYRLLAKQKEQRYPDARTVRIALERYRSSLMPKHGKQEDALMDVVTTGGPDLSGLVSVAKPLPEALRPRPLTLADSLPEHRRRGLGIAVVVVLALAAAGAAWYFLLGPGAAPARTLAPPPEPAPEQAEPEVKAPPETKAVPKDLPEKPGPTDAELAEIDDLATQDKLDEAAAKLAAVHAKYPGDAQVRWREARLQALRPDGAAASIGLYAEALALDPSLAKDLGFHAQVDALLRQRPVREPAIDLAIALGKQGHGILLSYINDKTGWASYAQRLKIFAALEKEGAADEVDRVLATRLNLEQYKQSPTPCQTMKAALTTIAAEPKPEYVEALKAAVAPKPAAAEPEKSACKESSALLATARTAYAQAFPDAFPAPKKKPPKKKRRH